MLKQAHTTSRRASNEQQVLLISPSTVDAELELLREVFFSTLATRLYEISCNKYKQV